MEACMVDTASLPSLARLTQLLDLHLILRGDIQGETHLNCHVRPIKRLLGGGGGGINTVPGSGI